MENNDQFLSRIIVEGFRGAELLDFSLSKKTQIIGSNGSGKTHILDAIHLLAGARILYGSTQLEKNARIEGFFGDQILKKSYIFTADEKKAFFLIQNKKITRPKYKIEIPFLSVYISPFDMNMLYFAPEMRRNYIDDVLQRGFGQFGKIKKEFESIMRQRNALLKKIREGEARQDGLEFWDTKFAEYAYKYGLYRTKYIQFIQESINENKDYALFFGKYDIHIRYLGDWMHQQDPEKYLIEELSHNRERDIFSGHTHIGPHRDDFGFFLGEGDRSVQFFLSRGEMKMILLGMKFIEANFLEKYTEKSIILLIDDIFAELDEKNSKNFFNIITQHQMILTSQKSLEIANNSQKISCINLDFS